LAATLPSCSNWCITGRDTAVSAVSVPAKNADPT